MATTKSSSSSKDTKKAAPIVYERDDADDGGNREYSDGTKDFQKVFEGGVEFFDRFGQALADGVTKYRDKHDESARKKKDGGVRDFVANANEGFAEALEGAADAQRKFGDKVTTRRLTRLITPQPLNIFLRD